METMKKAYQQPQTNVLEVELAQLVMSSNEVNGINTPNPIEREDKDLEF